MRKLHGVISITLFFGAPVIGLYAVISLCELAGIIYGGFIVLSVPAILYSFCAKCPCRENCGHVVPGFMTRFLPSRKEGPYTNTEIAVVVISVGGLLGIPQYWLWQIAYLPYIFWGMAIIAAVQINLFVCKGCENSFCPLNENNYFWLIP